MRLHFISRMAVRQLAKRYEFKLPLEMREKVELPTGAAIYRDIYGDYFLATKTIDGSDWPEGVILASGEATSRAGKLYLTMPKLIKPIKTKRKRKAKPKEKPKVQTPQIQEQWEPSPACLWEPPPFLKRSRKRAKQKSGANQTKIRRKKKERGKCITGKNGDCLKTDIAAAAS